MIREKILLCNFDILRRIYALVLSHLLIIHFLAQYLFMKIKLLLLSFMCFVSFRLSKIKGQILSSGPQVLSFHSDVDDTEQPYALYIPKKYKPNKKYPLVVMLHGAGSNHRLAMRRVFGKSNQNGENDVEASRYFPAWKDVDYIVAAPYARGTAGYQGIVEKDVLDMLADVKKRFPIDEDRTYLTGLSMGGGGTLWLGLSYPDIWAAIAPVCPAPPDGTKEKLGNTLNVPTHFFQGADDPVVKADSVRLLKDKMKELGNTVEYTEYPGVKHDSWVNAYQDEFVFSWFSKFKRNKFPDRVRFATPQYKYNKAYWIHFFGLTPGLLAQIDAQFTATNKLDIKTNQLDGFSLSLAGHPKFKTNSPLDISIDGQSLKIETANQASYMKKGMIVGVKTNPSIHLAKKDNQWLVLKTDSPDITQANNKGLVKMKNLEGPLSEAVASRHIYVYGTADNPDKATLEARYEQAKKAADWAFYRGDFLGRIMVFPRVVADKDLRPFDMESSHLILFGTKQTNSIISKYSDQLPLALNTMTAEKGLAYIYPVQNKYVLISSGLAWWDAPNIMAGGAQISRLSSPMTINSLRSLGDYLIFDKTTILVSGRFDNHWQLPKSEEAKVKAALGF
jgi:predicted esterase